MIRRLLVPWDGSELAERAMVIAGYLAERVSREAGEDGGGET